MTGPSSYKDLNQIWEDETGYSADGETSSSGSEKEISDSKDGLNKINTCEGNQKWSLNQKNFEDNRGFIIIYSLHLSIIMFTWLVMLNVLYLTPHILTHSKDVKVRYNITGI